jgi:4-hydroxy-tetrahydrodipicolinate reductase
MKIALIGYGQMGKMVEEAALRQNIEVVTKYWDEQPLIVNPSSRSILKGVSALIDFTLPDVVLDNIQKGAELSLNMVVGTTGWYDQIDKVKKIVEEHQIGLVYAANFSLGVNLFYKIVDKAASLFSTFENYDPFIEEAHHKIKKDAPSGTARNIKQILQDHYKKKEIPVTSVRAGYIPGMHRVSFDSKVDTVKLEHNARNREGLAEGALLAAKWIENRKGCFAFENVLDDILNQEWRFK